MKRVAILSKFISHEKLLKKTTVSNYSLRNSSVYDDPMNKNFVYGKITKDFVNRCIKSKKLKSMSKIMAHKEIFSILKDEMSNKIHALEIEIH